MSALAEWIVTDGWIAAALIVIACAVAPAIGIGAARVWLWWRKE